MSASAITKPYSELLFTASSMHVIRHQKPQHCLLFPIPSLHKSTMYYITILSRFSLPIAALVGPMGPSKTWDPHCFSLGCDSTSNFRQSSCEQLTCKGQQTELHQAFDAGCAVATGTGAWTCTGEHC